MQEGRPRRVAEIIKKEVAELILRGLKDPRIGFVSVMDVRVSADLRYADIYVSLYGEESKKKSSLIGLTRSAGWIRRELGKHLRLRYIPAVRFHEDTTLDRVYRLENLFEEIHAEQDQHDEETNDDNEE
ncbi:MAG: 30S ribosome-binding factor RbfA [Candidatus Hydrogenedentes bacterium]|nr:30S ribosome-binding factor RbfA [Candidatus Hydrogenedentota bacterium]